MVPFCSFAVPRFLPFKAATKPDMDIRLLRIPAQVIQVVPTDHEERGSPFPSVTYATTS